MNILQSVLGSQRPDIPFFHLLEPYVCFICNVEIFVLLIRRDWEKYNLLHFPESRSLLAAFKIFLLLVLSNLNLCALV